MDLEGLYSDQAWEEGRDVPDIHPAGFGILPDIRHAGYPAPNCRISGRKSGIRQMPDEPDFQIKFDKVGEKS